MSSRTVIQSVVSGRPITKPPNSNVDGGADAGASTRAVPLAEPSGSVARCRWARMRRNSPGTGCQGSGHQLRALASPLASPQWGFRFSRPGTNPRTRSLWYRSGFFEPLASRRRLPPHVRILAARIFLMLWCGASASRQMTSGVLVGDPDGGPAGGRASQVGRRAPVRPRDQRGGATVAVRSGRRRSHAWDGQTTSGTAGHGCTAPAGWPDAGSSRFVGRMVPTRGEHRPARRVTRDRIGPGTPAGHVGGARPAPVRPGS